MKHIFLISLLGAFVSVSAMGGPGPAGGGGEAAGPAEPGTGGADVPSPLEPEVPSEVSSEVQPGYFLAIYPNSIGGTGPVFETCVEGYYCPGYTTVLISSDCFDATVPMCSYIHDTSGNPILTRNQCPSNYDNTATGLTSIEECCLNGYDSNTGLCVESTPSAPRRVAITPSATNADCDSETLETNSGSTTLTAQWTANTITLNWYDGDTQYSTNTCTYDSGITLPTQPTKTGYNFAGWRVR